MLIAMTVKIGPHRLGHLTLRERLVGGAIVIATSALIGGIAALEQLLQPRDRWGRRKEVDPTGVLPFIWVRSWALSSRSVSGPVSASAGGENASFLDVKQRVDAID
jgi:hypothetical protein